jgi:hypothetical protein
MADIWDMEIDLKDAGNSILFTVDPISLDTLENKFFQQSSRAMRSTVFCLLFLTDVERTVSSRLLYPPISRHGVTTQKTIINILPHLSQRGHPYTGQLRALTDHFGAVGQGTVPHAWDDWRTYKKSYFNTSHAMNEVTLSLAALPCIFFWARGIVTENKPVLPSP